MDKTKREKLLVFSKKKDYIFNMAEIKNFLSEAAKIAEECFVATIVHYGKDWNVSLVDPPDNIREMAEHLIPERIKKIQKKSFVLDGAELLDQIGVDVLVKYEENLYAVDITTGSSTVIKNKRSKMEEIMPFLDAIGAKPVVLCWREPKDSEEQFVEILSRLTPEEQPFILDIRMHDR